MFKPKFAITNNINNALVHIERVRGFLDAAVLSEDWLDEMRDRALILEAHHTTHIEGTQLTLDQSKDLLSGEKVANVNPDDKQELLNYCEAFDFVSHYLAEEKPITEGLIREIHKKLVNDVRGNSAAPGEYRKIQNYVVNSKTQQVIYEPPPAYEVPHMMTELVSYLRTEAEINPILVSGIAQFQLVHIHPFLDGNGRTARLLSTLHLYKKGYDFKRLFAISEYYDRNRVHYYEAIQSVRKNDMDMTPWLEYFTHALEMQMNEIKMRGERVITIDVMVKKHQLSNRQKEILNVFVREKRREFKIKDLQNLLNNKYPERTLRRDLNVLKDKGLIESAGHTHKSVWFIK